MVKLTIRKKTDAQAQIVSELPLYATLGVQGEFCFPETCSATDNT